MVSVRSRADQKKGTALVAYMVKPFLLKDRTKVSSSHTHFVESLLMVNVLLEMGYDVDVIDFENNTFVPAKSYDIFLSVRKHFQRYAEMLGGDCMKVVHLDVSHWLYNNTVAVKRCHDVLKRKGVALDSYRRIEANKAIECADFATMLGNDYSMGTYAYSGKEIYPVPIPVRTGTSKPDKDFDRIRKNFIWFGSQGLVHKGLDLVLEAFAEMPDYNLKVCGPIEEEPDFKKAFHRELYQSKNIQTIGWVDVTSEKFAEIANDTAALLYPSCAEGQCGAVVTCMTAGIIPVVSVESGINIAPEYGRNLKGITVEAVKEAVKAIAALPSEDLRKMSENAAAYTAKNHTKEQYMRRLGEVLRDGLARRRARPDGVESESVSVGS